MDGTGRREQGKILTTEIHTRLDNTGFKYEASKQANVGQGVGGGGRRVAVFPHQLVECYEKRNLKLTESLFKEYNFAAKSCMYIPITIQSAKYFKTTNTEIFRYFMILVYFMIFLWELLLLKRMQSCTTDCSRSE